MIKIQYDGDTALYEAAFRRVNDHVVALAGDIPVSTAGFCTYRMSGEQLGDFLDYKTVYQIGDGEICYSNDWSTSADPCEYPAVEPTLADDTTPSQLDILEAQVMWTAMMTGTLLEV